MPSLVSSSSSASEEESGHTETIEFESEDEWFWQTVPQMIQAVPQWFNLFLLKLRSGQSSHSRKDVGISQLWKKLRQRKPKLPKQVKG